MLNIFQVVTPETYRVVRYLRDESAHFEKKDETVPKYPHFLVVSTKFGTIFFQTFCLKKQEEICRSEENFHFFHSSLYK